MKNLSFVLPLAILAITAGPVESKPKYNPFLVPRDSILMSVKRVALRQVSGVPEDHPRRAGIVAEFDSLLSAELRSAGFEVVSSAAVDTLQKRMRDSMGGLFDPGTGKPDTVKAQLLRRRVLDALRDEFHADAWLHPSFDVYTAGFNGGTATWMGASETVRPKGLLGFLGSNQVSGNVPAIALEVVIEDMTGRNVFVDIGGLQVLEKYSLSHKFAKVPQDSLWANSRRNSDCVRLALGALTRTPKKTKR